MGVVRQKVSGVVTIRTAKLYDAVKYTQKAIPAFSQSFNQPVETQFRQQAFQSFGLFLRQIVCFADVFTEVI